MTLTIPARPEWAIALSLAASGIGAVYDLPLDVADDLKTALEESCDLLIHQPYCVRSLTLVCGADKDGLRVTLTAERCHEKQPEPPADADIAGLIIGTLVREVRLSKDDEGVRGVEMLLPAKENGR